MKDQPTIDPGPPEFSLIRGGPWYQLQLWLRLVRPDSLQVGTRAALYALLAWAPLAALTILSGTARAVPGGISFLQDVAVHVRFLIALPLLVLAEAQIDRYTAAVVAHVRVSGIVAADGRAKIEQTIRSTVRLRDSWIVALVLVGLAVFAGWSRLTQTPAALSTWFEPSMGPSPSPAGYWLGFVSTPLFVSILLRDLWRFALWARFLLSLSRTRLELTPAHPDRMGGLGSLQIAQQPFAAVLFAIGAVFSATIANRVLYNGAHLLDFKMLAASLIACATVLYVLPLLAFTPRLILCKRFGVLDYNHLGGDYTREFDKKWIRPKLSPAEPLLGTSDIQSLADLGNSFERVQNMRIVALDPKAVLTPVFAVGVPLLPLALMVMPLSDLLKLLLKALV